MAHCQQDHSGPSWDSRRGSRLHSELSTPNARLVRDPVDPLRLRLTCLLNHQPMPSSSSSSPIPPERWTFSIQIPRMYPHVPPNVTRVTRDFTTSNDENIMDLGNMHNHYSSASAAMVASSVMQSNVEPPVPEQILIQPLPPNPHHTQYSNNGGLGDEPNNHKLLDIDLATCVFNSWSPVSALNDLIEFLMGIPARRRDWWSVESNRRHHQEQQRFLRSQSNNDASSFGHPVRQPAFAPATTSFFASQHDQQQHEQFQTFEQPKHFHHQISTSHSDMEGGDMNIAETMMEDGGTMSPDRRVNPFTTNRFDVGYERGGMIRRWGVH